MTFEELFLAIDDCRADLKGSAMALMVHLIAQGIDQATNEVSLSASAIAKNLGLSRDTVRKAAQAVGGFIRITNLNGVAYRFLMPADWFMEQQALFNSLKVVENKPKLKRIPAGTYLETRQVGDDIPGRHPPGNQAGDLETRQVPEDFLGRRPGNQAGSRLETRQVPTRNQQLTGGGGTIESIGLTGSSPLQSEILDRIVRADHVPEIQLELSSVLSKHLRDYAHEHGPAKLAAAIPDEIILARCFAIAPLGELTTLLRAMHLKRTRTGDSFAWFVAVFANRIHGIKSQDLREALTRHFSRRQPARERNPMFSRNLSAEVNQQAHSMR